MFITSENCSLSVQKCLLDIKDTLKLRMADQCKSKYDSLDELRE